MSNKTKLLGLISLLALSISLFVFNIIVKRQTRHNLSAKVESELNSVPVHNPYNLDVPPDRGGYLEDFWIDPKFPDKSTYPSPEPVLGVTTAATDKRPNIIVIISDDQPNTFLGLAGNKILQTPNIDNLANRGMYFTNFYVPQGVCSPSRASILTGKLPHVHGLTRLNLLLPPEQPTLPKILQSNGYNTAIIGKCHLGHPFDPLAINYGFNDRLIVVPDIGTVGGGFGGFVATNKLPVSWTNYDIVRDGTLLGNPTVATPSPELQSTYITDYFTDQAIEYVTKASADPTGKPFFLWLSHVAPHRPATPKEGCIKYKNAPISEPSSASDDLSTKPLIQSKTHTHYVYDTGFQTLNDYPDPVPLTERIRDVYEVMDNLDQNVGRLTKTLEELKLTDNTIIIYLSDNSLPFGEHQLVYKGPFLYDELVKVPFIIYYPQQF